jgi:CBS domain containing-hemolysin-like protein
MRYQPSGKLPRATRWLFGLMFALLWALPATAHAGFLSGSALDTAADIMTWVVLVIAPVVGIGVFLLIHILPEKIAEKNHHPQTKAIQCLCLLSLVFGGMLWPLAWLWAYSKPVLHQLAYGTDKVAHGEEDQARPVSARESAGELRELRQRVAELESRLGGGSASEGRVV